MLAGLEVIRTLNDLGYETDAPIEVSAWTNEEGSRFAPAMVASGVFGGVFTLEEGLACADVDGKTIGEELERIGYAGEMECGGRAVGAFFEAHIEQGPILEAEEKTIGIVQGVQGISWFDVTVTGMESHAGTTPMERRKDAMVGAAMLVAAIDQLALDNAPDARSTIGVMRVSPNSRNVIPGSVYFSVDLRHPDPDTLAAMTAEAQRQAEALAAARGLEITFEEIWHSPPIKFAADCVGAVQNAAEALGYANQPITSGAGHDAVYVSRVAPTGMIFIPCEDGISHNEIEAATQADVAAGCDVLLNAMVALATRDEGEVRHARARDPYPATSRRTMAAPSTIALSLPNAVSRVRYFMPQSGAATRRSAGTTASASRSRAATVSGRSMAGSFMSITP